MFVIQLSIAMYKNYDKKEQFRFRNRDNSIKRNHATP